jgi:hypothetical protein
MQRIVPLFEDELGAADEVKAVESAGPAGR